MDLLERYERTKTSFSKINDTMGPVLDKLPCQAARPAHRANDAALILFSVFAFEGLCWDCIHEVERGHRDCGISLIPALREAACLCGTLGDLSAELDRLGPVMEIRNLYAHAAGRRSGLDKPDKLRPPTLREYLFETDSCHDCPDQHACDKCARTDLTTEWWPTRSLPTSRGSFHVVGGQLNALAPLVVEKLKCR